ncbi:epoxide hydrolase family protein [Croceicoccus estronivorus]|uniref:epoxide hydrolase family protein n=1 Tax=Croceicoccus estronivorus TaxID=1172626 RepID=UPI000B0FF631|nr:epoxide hydrolase family protein [Croceicoccus estronivorus]
MKPEAFQIAIPQSDLDDLQRRLENVRWPADPGNENWRFGVDGDWMKGMVEYWRDGFDWRAQEAEMNRYPHYRVEIDGNPIHFLHIPAKTGKGMPLILTHGWPWTFWDYRDVIGRLTDPAAYGGDPADAFELVIPSLPGFGFSPLARTGIAVPEVADLWCKLMQDVLGHDRFAAAGGDWGAAVTAYLGHAYPEALTGIYCTLPMLPGLGPAEIRPGDYAADEAWMLERNIESWPLVDSHITVQKRDPQTLAYAMADSPVGTAAWLWERRRAWSDCGGDVLSVFDRDALCTLASVYWLTGTIGTSFRIYAEQFVSALSIPLAHDKQPIIAAPTAFGIFPKEINLVPRALIERQADLRQWRIHDGGGHFAPVERPADVVGDLRDFLRPLRGK